MVVLLLPLLGGFGCGDDTSASETDTITTAQLTTTSGVETTGETMQTGGSQTGETDDTTEGPDTSGSSETETSDTSDTTSESTDTDTTDSDTSDTTDATDTGMGDGCQGDVDPGTVVCEGEYDNVNFGWARVERWDDPDPEIENMNFPPDGRGDVNGQRLTFFDNVTQPESSEFLLYYAPGWDSGESTPVLLVHGANDSPDRAWANPNETGAYGCGAEQCPETGMMQGLTQAGHRVFAIGFGHRQGDNLTAAKLIGDALAVVRERTGAASVDVIGWSMGAFSARMYTSSVGATYAGDVRKLILIGGPNHGFDYLFRYGINHNTLIFPECAEPLMVDPVNAPAPHLSTMCYGVMYEHPELSVFTVDAGDFYPGQKQMLFRWDDVYDIPQSNQDWYTTYHGGDGFVSSGLGIDVAIGQGSLVQEILDAGVPASVPTYLLCGDTKGESENEIPVIPNEVSGPSDGVVFIDSCADETGIATLGASTLIEQNHLKLGWHPEGVDVIKGWLAD